MHSAKDTVREIRHLFETGDLSCSAVFRRLAQEYAAASAELAEDLEKCREILHCGTAGDALEFNRRFSPPLTERAAQLVFPERAQWVQLCREYRAAVPEEPDQELLAMLSSETVRTAAEGSRDLLQSWRRMARTGSPEEKLGLLRQLIKADPENPVWRKNIQYAESAWFNERLQEAAAAFREHRDEELAEIYQRCIRAPLQTPFPSAAFAPYMEPIRRCRKQQLARQLHEQLEKVGNACAMEDPEALQRALEQWDKLVAEPDAEPENGSALQIAAARKFLAEKNEERIRLQTMTELRNTLTMQLDEPADFTDIARTFHRLEELGPAAVPETLAIRFLQAEQRIAEESRRRHFRMMVFGILLTGLLVSGTVAGTGMLLSRRACSKICIALDAMLKKDAPEAVLREVERLGRTAPKIAGSAEVRARKMLAEIRLQQQRSDSQKFDRLLKKAGDACTENRVESPAAEQHFRELEKSSLFRTEQQQTAMTELGWKRAEMLTAMQDRRDQAFLQEYRRIVRQLNMVMVRLDDEFSSELPALEQMLSALEKSIQDLSGSRVRQKVAGKLPELRKMLAAVQARLQEVQSFRRLHRRLMQPENAEDYRAALQETAKYPKLTAAFAAAGKQFEGPAGALSGTPDAADAAMTAYHLSAADCVKSLRELREKWRKMLDFYVLSLAAADGTWHFCSPGPAVKIEHAHGGLGGSFVSLSMQIVLPDGRIMPVIFRIGSGKNGLQLAPVSGGRLYSEGLPKEFEPVPSGYLPRLEKEGLPRASWREYVLSLLPSEPSGKTAAEDLDRLLEKVLQKLLQTPEIPNRWKMALASELFQAWGGLSAVNRHIATVLRISPKDLAADTGVPPFAPKAWQTETMRLQEGFHGALAAKQLFRQCAVNAPFPVGVLYQHRGNYILRGFEELPEKVWIVMTSGRSGMMTKACYMEAETRWFAAPGLAETRLRPLARKDFFHGKLVFAPAGGLPPVPAELRQTALPLPALLEPAVPLTEFLQ